MRKAHLVLISFVIVHATEASIPIVIIINIIIKFAQKNFCAWAGRQFKYTLLDYSTDKIVYDIYIFLSFLHPLRQRSALLRSADLIFVLLKFIVSEYVSFRFSLSFSASFWKAFVEPGAAPAVHAKISLDFHKWCASRSYLEV